MKTSWRAAFLDRDGVLTAKLGPGEHVERAEDLVIADGAVEAVRMLREHGFWPIIVSNQRCVSHEVLQEIDDALRVAGVDYLASYYCTHDRDAACNCRKPQTGLLRHAARDYDLDMGECVLIGDDDVDMQAGRAVGCHTIRVSPVVDVLTAAKLAVSWGSTR